MNPSNMTNYELKMKARERLVGKSGTLAKSALIYGGIYLAIFFALSYVLISNVASSAVFNSVEEFQEYLMSMEKDFKYQAISFVVLMIVQAVMATILAGFQYMCLNVARGNEIKVSDIFHVVKNNPDKIIIIDIFLSVASLLFSLPATAIVYLADINGGNNFLMTIEPLVEIAGTVATIWLTVMMSQCVFIFLDNPQEAAFTIIKKSFALIKGNGGRYVFMWISFIPFLFLILFTCGIAFLWVLPYQQTSFAMLYMQLNGEFNQGIDNNESEIENTAW